MFLQKCLNTVNVWESHLSSWAKRRHWTPAFKTVKCCVRWLEQETKTNMHQFIRKMSNCSIPKPQREEVCSAIKILPKEFPTNKCTESHGWNSGISEVHEIFLTSIIATGSSPLWYTCVSSPLHREMQLTFNICSCCELLRGSLNSDRSNWPSLALDILWLIHLQHQNYMLQVCFQMCKLANKQCVIYLRLHDYSMTAKYPWLREIPGQFSL